MYCLNDLKEYYRLISLIGKIEATLYNPNFINKAPSNIVEAEREKLRYNLNKVEHISTKVTSELTNSFSLSFITYIIQNYREESTKLEEFSKEWFDFIYNDFYTKLELMDSYCYIYKICIV